VKDEILDDGLLPNWEGVESKEFVEIRTYTFDHQAQIAKAFLDAEGIPSFLKNATMLSVYSGLSAGLGGVGLIVLSKDAQRALDVLADEEEEIEVDDEMLNEAYLRDMELEAAENEKIVEDPTTSWNVISSIITISFIVVLVIYLLYFFLG